MESMVKPAQNTCVKQKSGIKIAATLPRTAGSSAQTKPLNSNSKRYMLEPKKMATVGSNIAKKQTPSRGTWKTPASSIINCGLLGKKAEPITTYRRATVKTVTPSLASKKKSVAAPRATVAEKKAVLEAPKMISPINEKEIAASSTTSLEEQHTDNIRRFLKKSVSEIDLNSSTTQSAIATWRFDEQKPNESGFPAEYFHKNPGYDANSSDYHAMREAAALKIYAMFVLNIWRKQCSELQYFRNELTVLKRAHTAFRNQKLVLNTLLHVERNRNAKMCKKLEEVRASKHTSLESCKQLENSVSNLSVAKTTLQEQFQLREQQCSDLMKNIAENEAELDETYSQQDNLRSRLQREKSRSEMLEKEVKELVEEIHKLNVKRRAAAKKLEMEIIAKDREIEKVQGDIKNMTLVVEKIKDKEQEIKEHAVAELKLRAEADNLRKEINALQSCIQNTLAQRFKRYWRTNASIYQVATIQILHCIAFCLLPAARSPQNTMLIPSELFLEEALRLIKR